MTEGQRRKCSTCGKRRIGAFWLTDYTGRVHKGTQGHIAVTTGSDPKFWPRFRGWLCREHSTLEALSASSQGAGE